MYSFVYVFKCVHEYTTYNIIYSLYIHKNIALDAFRRYHYWSSV